jgi:hypothetical protein
MLQHCFFKLKKKNLAHNEAHAIITMLSMFGNAAGCAFSKKKLYF